MDIRRLRGLAPRQRALIAVAVLLDGRDAVEILEMDASHGRGLKQATQEAANIEPELRMALMGVVLRTAVRELTSIANVSLAAEER